MVVSPTELERSASAQVPMGLRRIYTKAALLAQATGLNLLICSDTSSTVTFSEVDIPQDYDLRLVACERNLSSIESKLDRLLELQLNAQDSPPPWFLKSSERLLREVVNVGGQVRNLSANQSHSESENKMLRREIETLAVGSDKFLAGLRGRLNERETALFFELIYTEAGQFGNRRVRSYQEIGPRLGGISKQAVHARAKNMERKHPDVWAYVKAIRQPVQAIPFSGLSPSERRKSGLDDAYNYDAG